MRPKKLTLFFLIAVLFNLGASFVHPVTPTLIIERNLDSSMFGVAFAAMQLMNFLFSPFWGQLCTYIPTKRILLISGIGYAVGQCIFGLAQTEAVVIGGRMFSGIFIGGCYTAMLNYAVNLSENDPSIRGTNLVVLTTIQSVGGACGYFIGGMLGVISVMTAFISQVIVLALCGVLFYCACIDDTYYKPAVTSRLTMKACNPFAAIIDARKFMTPMLGLIFGIVAVSAIGQNSYEQCFNYFIKDQYGMSSVWNGGLKAVIAILTLILNSTVSIYLQHKTDINKSFIYVISACVALSGIGMVSDQRILFVSVFVIYSSVMLLRLPLLQGMAAERTKGSFSNQVMGFYQSMNSLGGIFGALFAGLIYEAYARLPVILAFIAFCIAWIMGIVYRKAYSREQAISRG